VNFINSRRNKKRFIKKMDFFSHGLVGSIEFGYDTKKADSYRFREAQVRMLKPAMFHDDAIITSYACRTGPLWCGQSCWFVWNTQRAARREKSVQACSVGE
jgi:hypothetical protein